MRPWYAWTSTNPASQRSGRVTFRSTTDSPPRDSSTASAPIARPRRSPSRTRASAARIGALKSTLVVPRPIRSPSSAEDRKSARAYAPQHAENASNRTTSSPQVTTGSAGMIRASIAGGM